MNQDIRSGCFKVSVAIAAGVQFLADAVGWTTRTASVLRAKIVAGDYTVPQVNAFVWASVKTAKCKSAQERASLDNQLGNIANRVGLTNS